MGYFTIWLAFYCYQKMEFDPDHLVSSDPRELDTAWTTLVRHPILAHKVSTENRARTVEAGYQLWTNCLTLNTTSWCRIFKETLDVCIVSSSFPKYRDSWLFGLAMAWGVEAPNFDLASDQSNAAFKLSELLSKSQEGLPDVNPGVPEVEAASITMPWDKEVWDMDVHLEELWKRAKTPINYEVRKALIDDIPLFKSIPEYGPDNNCKKESAQAMDRIHKQWETQLYNALRIVGVLDTTLRQGADAEFDAEELVHRAFYVLADLSQRVHDHRKNKSIPGSVAKDNLLFSKEDIQHAKFAQSVNRLGYGAKPRGTSGGDFRRKGKSTYGGYGSGKGYGRGYGKNSYQGENSKGHGGRAQGSSPSSTPL